MTEEKSKHATEEIMEHKHIEKAAEEKKTHEHKEEKIENKKVSGKKTKSENESSEKIAEDKKTDKKKDSKPKVKKYEAVAYGRSLPISKKHSMFIGSFIKNKSIDTAISQLGEVLKYRRAVPYKGEIPHRKGNMMSGRYPINASKEFITLLKSLRGNSLVNGMDLDKTLITIVSPTWAARPMKSGGRKAKRVNIILKAREISGGKK